MKKLVWLFIICLVEGSLSTSNESTTTPASIPSTTIHASRASSPSSTTSTRSIQPPATAITQPASTSSTTTTTTTTISAQPITTPTPTTPSTTTTTTKTTTVEPKRCQYNGTTNSNTSHEQSYQHGEAILITCNEGYKLNGTGSLTCTNGNWNGTLPTCTQIICPPPTPPDNGHYKPNKTSYNYSELVTYSCDNGYRFDGESSISNTSKCTDTGAWSSASPACIIKLCPPPTPPDNGHYTPNKTSYNYGESVTYSCDNGYRFDGESGISNMSKCTDTGAWSSASPTCIIKLCPPPTPPDNGHYKPNKTSYNYGESVTYSCDNGYRFDGESGISNTSKCTDTGSWSLEIPACIKRIPYNGICLGIESMVNECMTHGANCQQMSEEEKRCVCVSTHFHREADDTCLTKIPYKGQCDQAIPDYQCETREAHCLNITLESPTCVCNDTFYLYNNACVEKFQYNIYLLSFDMISDSTTTNTATLRWFDHPSLHPFAYFKVVVENDDGTVVYNATVPRNIDAPYRHIITGLEPGQHYSAVVHIYDSRGVPGINTTHVSFFTRPLGISCSKLINVTTTSFTVTWDDNSSYSFSHIVVVLSSSYGIPEYLFVNCFKKGQRNCTVDRDNGSTSVRVEKLTPGTMYTVTLYTSIGGMLSSPYEIKDNYTVPKLPKFNVGCKGASVTDTSITVTWNDTDGSFIGQFQQWHVVINGTTNIMKNESFGYSEKVGHLTGLDPASRYTVEFYTSVPGQKSRSSPPLPCYTRPSDVAEVDVKNVHENNLTVTILNPVNTIFYKVSITPVDSSTINEQNVTVDPWSAIMTSLQPATNYSINVYAVLSKDDETILPSSKAYTTWSYSGPTAPTNVNVTSVNRDSLNFIPLHHLSELVRYDVQYTVDSTNWAWQYDFTNYVQLVNLTTGTHYRIRVFTKLLQSTQPKSILSDTFYEFYQYTTPPAVDPSYIHVLNTTTDSLTIMWSKPSKGDVENYQFLLNFTCTSPNDNTEETVIPLPRINSSTVATTTKLDPGTSCTVYIQVCVGDQFSEVCKLLLDKKTNETAPGKVRGLTCSAPGPQNINVTWRDPSFKNGVIRRYDIIIPEYKQGTCEPGDPFSADVYCERTIVFLCEDCEDLVTATETSTMKRENCTQKTPVYFKRGQKDFSYLVTGLHSYMNYSIQVRAYTFTDGVVDKKYVLTTQTAPGVSPVINGNSSNSSSITVEWIDPECGQRNGPLGMYYISYNYTDDTVCSDQNGEVILKNASVTTKEITIANLSAFWNYNVTVRASHGAGQSSNPSNTLSIKTKESIPDMVRNVTTDAMNASSLSISWRQPCFPKGSITNYTIQLNNTDTNGKVSTYYSGTDTAKTVNQLKPYRNYTVTVWANNGAGKGVVSAPSENRTVVGVPHKPTGVKVDVLSSRKVEVGWTATYYTGPTRYIAFVSTQANISCDTGIDFKASSCIIGNLKPFTNYSFIVSAITNAGTTYSTVSTNILTEESVPGVVTAIEVTPENNVTKQRSITLMWGPPERGNRNGLITGYDIVVSQTTPLELNATCKTDASNQNNVSCSLSVSIKCETKGVPRDVMWSCQIANIKTGEFTLTVLARTSVGPGPPTKQAARVSPGAPLRVEETDSQTLIQHGSSSVDDQKRQIAVQFPRDVICNEDNGKPKSWGIVIAEESLATGTPYIGDKKSFEENVRSQYKTWFQVDHSGNMAPYIASADAWNPCESVKGSRKKRSTGSEQIGFVVGASGTCSGVTPGSRCNGELVPDKSYSWPSRFPLRLCDDRKIIILYEDFSEIRKRKEVKMYICTDGGCTETKYSSAISTDKLFPVAAVAGSVAAVIVIIILIGVTICMKRRQMLCFRKSGDEEVPSHRSEPPVSSSEMKDISRHPSRRLKLAPVTLAEFPQYVDKLHRDSNMQFSDAYSMLKEESPVHPMTAAESQKNRPKNRYTNILSYDHSRVKLLPIDDDEESDYINANYIPGYTSKREYIACQGPLVSTFNDFWRMTWEQNVDTIVMLTKLVEKGRHKCDKYWPELNEPVYFGDLVVCVQSESHLSDYTIRVMEVKLKESRRIVRQFCYLKWPDMGCPDQPAMLLDFVKSVKEYTKANSIKKGPMIVHCSAGVGRTGTFIAVDYLLQYIRDHDDIDIYKLVLDMRNHRCNMVQTEDQYVYIHECMKEFITQDDEEEDEEPVYVNTQNEENVYENTAFSADM